MVLKSLFLSVILRHSKVFFSFYSISSAYFFFFCAKYIMVAGGLVAQSCPTLATPWTVALQVPLSMRFSRQEYWSGVPLPSPPVLY